MKITIHRISSSTGLSALPIVINTAGMAPGRKAIVHAALAVLKNAPPPGPWIAGKATRYTVVIEEAGRLETSSFLDDGSVASRRYVTAVTTIEMNSTPAAPV